MTILGVGYSADAGAALVKNGKIIAAVNEERLNRKKLWFGIPHLSIGWVLEEGKVSINEIDYIATHGACENRGSRRSYFEEIEKLIMNSKEIDDEAKEAQRGFLWKRYEHEEQVINVRTPNYLKEIKEKYNRPMKVFEHHIAHAASAYFTSGWNECYCLTADGWGEDASNILCHCKDGMIEKIAYSPTIDSLGYFYGSITKYLGFTPHKHEGKILGLSASGDRNKVYPILRKMVAFDEKRESFRGLIERGIYLPFFDNPNLEKYLGGYKREDIAAAAQRVLEEVVLGYVKKLIPPNSKLALAGGIFANVLLNQKILSLPNIADVFIHPNMGDGGLALGSALYLYSQLRELKPFPISTVYWGSGFTNAEIEAELKSFKVSYEDIDDWDEVAKSQKLNYEYVEEIEERVAQLLRDGKVVAIFDGKMEYGPRALGNRSILYRPDDPSVNDWLNQRLRRSEFMPFAPFTLEEHAEECYHIVKNIKGPTKFMTITCDCTEKMKKTSPGVVHIDGTARPQLISEEQNPRYYKILKRYYELTGNPSLINTSFNMHEEPIVCTPRDALRAFVDGKLDYLAIGNFLVKHEA